MKEKRKLRRLALKSKTSKFNKLKFIGIILTLGIITAILSIYYSPTILDDFILHYNLHYNVIVHGNSDYCNTNILNTEILFNKIRKDIFNQNEALTELQILFKNDSEIVTPIAIIGSSGIGKTLLATKIILHFPWSDNVNYFKWSIFEDDNIKIHKLIRSLNRLSNCGQNLLIIDDLPLENLEMIIKFNDDALKKLAFTNIKRLILIYIFNLSRFTTLKDENYENNLINFKHNISNKINNVIFRSFNKNDLDDCIRNEITQLNINLKIDEINDIRNSIDGNRSGCKNVYAKVKLLMMK